ncbi:uncharacterized protein LOC103308725 [Acyrthosiphon pisum]|uniref:Uncharacterized protein n=1 Tax=Acyrthosiphon pisum TaxID=7029 RepID=A0A8R2JMW7_ACYPI|nr:uncharacterized protein LOC103308725 [Acyrthosiphon pisum]
MINTSKFSQCLIIFLVYNIMIIFTVSCDDTDKVDTENKTVPDFDVITEANNGDYFNYYFRSCKYVGQLKVLPKTFFKSVHNCDYIILPELDEVNDYEAYKKKMKKTNKIFKAVFDRYNKDHKNIKEQEDHFVQQIDKSYEATKNAYDKVINYETYSITEQDKENAISNYLVNQMPEMSEKTFPNANGNERNRYTYKNFEVYADPTDEVYYRSNILQEEYYAVTDRDYIKTCDVILTKEEYDEVLFLYAFLNSNICVQSEFTNVKIDLFLHLRKYIFTIEYEL